MALNPIIVH